MSPEEIDECFEYVSQLVKQCNEVLKEGFKNCGEITTKTADHDIVTIYDKKIEEILMKGISEKYPNHRFIAEEESAANDEINALTSAPTWIIDPIDGTINFVKSLHFVCIAVAFVIDRQIEFSFLSNPTLNEFYTARKGKGAFLNGERIFVSKQEGMKGSLIAHEISLGCVPALRPSYIARCEKFMEKVIAVRALGSAALTLGYIAKGSIDAYAIEFLKPWDIAAGALIVTEAGGVIIDRFGGEMNIMKPDIIAASTLSLAMEIKESIDEVEAILEAQGKLPKQLMKTK